jgi:hypothetical protein
LYAHFSGRPLGELSAAGFEDGSLMRCLACESPVSHATGIVCPNFGIRRGLWDSCSSAWHGRCYVPWIEVRYPQGLRLKEEEDEKSALEEEEKEQEDQEFRFACAGDRLICPFQCDLCHFRNVTGTDPNEGAMGDVLEHAVKCYNNVHSNVSLKIRARAKAGSASFRSLCRSAAGARLSPAEIRVLPAEIEVPPAEIEVPPAEIEVRKLKFTYAKLKLEFLRVISELFSRALFVTATATATATTTTGQPCMPTTIAIAKRGRFCRSHEMTISNGNTNCAELIRRRLQDLLC